MIEIKTTLRGVPVSVRATVFSDETTAEERAKYPADAMAAVVQDIEITSDDDRAAEVLDGFDSESPEMRGIFEELITAYVRRGGDA